MLPDHLLNIPFCQWELLLREPQELEQEWRYEQMDPDVREKALDFKRRYGGF